MWITILSRMAQLAIGPRAEAEEDRHQPPWPNGQRRRRCRMVFAGFCLPMKGLTVSETNWPHVAVYSLRSKTGKSPVLFPSHELRWLSLLAPDLSVWPSCWQLHNDVKPGSLWGRESNSKKPHPNSSTFQSQHLAFDRQIVSLQRVCLPAMCCWLFRTSSSWTMVSQLPQQL